MPLDYSNPQVLKFFIENYEREQEKRAFWFHKHKDAIIKAAQFPENYEDIRTEDVRRVPVEMYMPIFAQDYTNYLVNHRKNVNIDSYSPRPLKASKSKPIMLPIEPTVADIHHEALPEGGRVQYLKARNHQKPEEKYNYDQTTSHVYGWALGDSNLKPQGPTYGRYSIFIHDLNSRSGPHPDPQHYQKPPKYPYSKCL